MRCNLQETLWAGRGLTAAEEAPGEFQTGTEEARRMGLSGAAAAGGSVANGAVDERALQGLKMRQEDGDLGQKRIGENGGHFLFAAAAGVADQLAYIHFEGVGQTFERAEGGDRLAILDFGDIGAWHLHAQGQLTLAEVAGAADFPDLSGNLQAGFGRRRRRCPATRS